MWISSSAPFVEEREGAAPALLSLVLADIGRAARAGATDDEIASRLAGAPLASLEAKLAALDAWEHQQVMKAMGAED